MSRMLRLTHLRGKILHLRYINWRGVRDIRKVTFTDMWYGANKWHPDVQMFLSGYDHEREAERHFAVRDIESIKVDVDSIDEEMRSKLRKPPGEIYVI